jgi:hypothetical protein
MSLVTPLKVSMSWLTCFISGPESLLPRLLILPIEKRLEPRDLSVPGGDGSGEPVSGMFSLLHRRILALFRFIQSHIYTDTDTHTYTHACQ